MAMDPKLYQLLLDTFKEELYGLHQSLISALLSLEKVHTEAELENALKELFRFSHNIKGASASASVKSVSEMAHKLEDLFSDWRQKKHFPQKHEVSACLEVVDNLLLAFNAYCQHEDVDIKTYLAPLQNKHYQEKSIVHPIHPEQYLKVPLARIEHASAKAAEFIPYQLKLDHWSKQVKQVMQQLTEANPDGLQLALLAKNLAKISADSEQFVEEFIRATQSLQDEMKAMRMVPISVLWVPLSRDVRDLSHALNKSVELQFEGGEIELDKSILDIITDPLHHLIRNAVDHGIEADAVRQANQKLTPAKLVVRISHVAAKIKIEVIDDGAGINIKHIKKQLISSKQLTNKTLKTLTDDEILNYIFASGFSTQKEVTEISGRGVGLDVVKNSIQAIGGCVSVDTTVNQGCCFTLIIPLTATTTRGVFFTVNQQKLMLPTVSLKMLYEVKPAQLKQVDNQYVFMIQNKPVAVKLMSQVLHIPDTLIHLDKTYYGLLLAFQQDELLFLVDSIVDEHDYLVKALPFPYQQIAHYIGTALTSDNDLALVLDPAILMQMALSNTTSSLSAIHFLVPEKKQTHKKRVLVVDDSLTSRTLCSNAVITAGFDSASVVDGKKAWDLMQQESFDCVITDILMPEMDGFELTKRIKDDKQYHHIPVIIVSSLDSKEDKKKGMDVGADAFVVKNEFDTLSLLHIMESLL